MEKIYLVLVDKYEQTEPYCLAQETYCAGVYADKKSAEKRALDFDEDNEVSIKELIFNQDLFVYKQHVGDVEDTDAFFESEDYEKSRQNHLVGAFYIE